MKAFNLEIEIARPVPEVFIFLAESENAPLWYEAVTSVRKLTPGPVQQGTLYQMTRALPHGTMVNEVETSEYEKNSLVTLQSRHGPTPFTYRYTLRPTLEGTHLTLVGTISGEGLKGTPALLAPLAQALFKRGMASNLDKLKHRLEEGDDWYRVLAFSNWRSSHCRPKAAGFRYGFSAYRAGDRG